jgi:hypothetical protein
MTITKTKGGYQVKSLPFSSVQFSSLLFPSGGICGKFPEECGTSRNFRTEVS